MDGAEHQDTPVRPGSAEARVRERWAHPRREALEEIQAAEWTSHNIPLSAGRSTLPEHTELIGEDGRVRLIHRTLERWRGGGKSGTGGLAGLRLVDLGCLEGGISFEMARRGMEVLGIEGRAANFEKCRLVKEYFGLPNLEFLHLDVRQLDPQRHGTFDIVLCCGLLYHLEDPFSFLDSLAALSRPGGLLFLDTHVAPRDREALEASRFRDQLSAIEAWAGPALGAAAPYRGRWFQEFSGRRGTEEPWAAVGNPRSFWPTEESLLRAVSRSGFRDVSKLYGVVEMDRELALRREFSRGYFLAFRGEG